MSLSPYLDAVKLLRDIESRLVHWTSESQKAVEIQEIKEFLKEASAKINEVDNSKSLPVGSYNCTFE